MQSIWAFRCLILIALSGPVYSVLWQAGLLTEPVKGSNSAAFVVDLDSCFFQRPFTCRIFVFPTARLVFPVGDHSFGESRRVSASKAVPLRVPLKSQGRLLRLEFLVFSGLWLLAILDQVLEARRRSCLGDF